MNSSMIENNIYLTKEEILVILYALDEIEGKLRSQKIIIKKLNKKLNKGVE